MKKFSADILAVNKKGRILFWSAVIGITVLFIVLMNFGLIPVFFQLFWIGFVCYSFARYYLQTRKQLLKKVIGKIEITESHIIAGNLIFNINELKTILISVSGWRSYKKTNERDIPVSDLHTGDNNIISFVHNNKDLTFEVKLESKEDWEVLREHVISWYQRGIKVIENNHASRTYGLEILNYSQIQEFKKLIANPHAVK